MASFCSLIVITLFFAAVFLMNPAAAAADPPSTPVYSRIISLYAAHTENLITLGAGECLIGIDRQSVHLKGAAGKPVFSYHDDPERFLAARPDLVLIRPMIERGYPQLVARLEKSGIRVVSLQPTAVDQLAGYWRYLGALSGRAVRADAMVRSFENAVAEFNALSAAVSSPKRVYFEAMHAQMKTFTPGAMAIFALETAGGINVAADAPIRAENNIAIYGKERLLSHGPAIDVFLFQHGTMNPVSTEMILAEPGFGVIAAVNTRQVFPVDEAIVSRPTLRLLQGIYQIGCILYPETWCKAGKKILLDAGVGE
ncbi:ABC transporter substrate-binding protein [Desulfosarcina sp. OttesenSCG-928-B08]|nr:ABC transporter substrate-binding protein [Desulfosarcina sp. OttesenSCG-928-B08]